MESPREGESYSFPTVRHLRHPAQRKSSSCWNLVRRPTGHQISLVGENAQVGFVLPGRWGKKDTKRLWPGGPVGEIVNDFGNGKVYVFFSAQEVKKAVLKEIGVTVE